LWETSGYDPRYEKDSPGTSLMLWMIRDLIENTDCRVFDFGMGGNYGYKARFGNTSLTCDWIQIGQWRRPYSVLLIMLDRTLNGTKNLIAVLVGSNSDLMKKLKRATRRYDASADAESRA
jgi:CelD/BcsL family acetyltransferase involved in cellulose biosynthesis